MAISFKRITKMLVIRRGLLTGLYGHTQDGEYFLGGDLGHYNCTQAIYCSLKKDGYRVVFYNPAPNVGYYTYDEADLIAFESFQTPGNANDGHVYIKKGLMTPFGPMEELDEPSSVPDGEETHHPSIYTHNPGNPSRTFYKLSVTGNPFDDVFAYAERHRGEKMAVVFENPGAINLSPGELAAVESNFANLLKDFSVDDVKMRMLVIYPEMNQNQLITAFTGGEANRTFFYSHTVAVHLGLAGLRDNGSGAAMSQEQQENFRRNMFRIGPPDEDEIRNMMVRERIVDGGYFVLRPGKPFDALVRAISTGNFKVSRPDGKSMFASEDDMTVRSLRSRNLRELVDGIKTDGAKERMRSLFGLEKPVERILHFVKQLKTLKEKAKKELIHLRLSMQFLGPPGVGKTTVARLTAQHMRDEGLLSKGHFVEVSAADLIGQYVGETRVKTQAVCEKAMGGVLFIDEAYSLYDPGQEGANIYGKEALDVIMQAMENNQDFAVIMAGYEDEMKQMEKANPGIPSRFAKGGIIHFDEYTPEALFSISKTLPPKGERTKDFDDKLMTIIKFLFNRRSRKAWGNAREVEQIMQDVYNLYLDDGGEDPVDVRHIPEDLLQKVDTAERSMEEILSSLKGLIGLKPIRRALERLARRCRISHIRSQGKKGQQYGSDINLNFVFIGRPGSGKTTTARCMGDILRLIGILSPGKLVVVTVDQLRSAIVGETAKNVQKICLDNIGNVLFIDEAYQADRAIIDKLTEIMTHPDYKGKLAIILAGYPVEMRQLIAQNPGLASRFGRNVIVFPDYNVDELWEILLSMMRQRGFSFSDEAACEPLAKNWFSSLPDTDEFANGRKCERLLEELENCCYLRLEESERDADHLSVFFPEDIVNVEGPVSDETALASRSAATEHLEVDLSIEDASERVSSTEDLPSAVGILGADQSSGTAFVISKRSRLVMTCSHVVEGARQITFRINALGGEALPGRVVWNSPQHDMAVVQVVSLPAGSKYVGLYPEGAPTVAPLTPIILCGFPLGERVSKNLMINSGEINNYEKDRVLSNGRRTDIYFSSVPAAPGDSGGPVMLADSFQVIGLLQGAREDVGNVGVRIIPDIASLYRDGNITITNPQTT